MRIRIIYLLIAIMLLTACGVGSGAKAAAGDPASGKKLFDGQAPMANASAPACSTCHAIEPGLDSGSGQSLSNIGSRAATAVADQTAEAYLRTSILDPDAYLASGYQEGIMYRGYAQALTSQQVDDLVAYLLTLKSDR